MLTQRYASSHSPNHSKQARESKSATSCANTSMCFVSLSFRPLRILCCTSATLFKSSANSVSNSEIKFSKSCTWIAAVVTSSLALATYKVIRVIQVIRVIRVYPDIVSIIMICVIKHCTGASFILYKACHRSKCV